MANDAKVSSTHKGMLAVPGLTHAAMSARVIPGIKHSLLPIVRLHKYAMPDTMLFLADGA